METVLIQIASSRREIPPLLFDHRSVTKTPCNSSLFVADTFEAEPVSMRLDATNRSPHVFSSADID